VRGLVVEVLAAALRDRGLHGVVVGAPPSPEAELLRGWLSPDLPLSDLPWGRVEPVLAVLEGNPAEGWMAVARAQAGREGLLVVHPANKLTLILGGAPASPCFPLGDIWPRELREWAGSASLPPSLSGMSQEDARQVEDRLRLGLEGGLGVRRALADLPPSLAERVRLDLRAGARLAAPPLVPKLTAWTAGVDPGA
jgi:hypothetical protein